jgi:hypothetical protein
MHKNVVSISYYILTSNLTIVNGARSSARPGRTIDERKLAMHFKAGPDIPREVEAVARFWPPEI